MSTTGFNTDFSKVQFFGQQTLQDSGTPYVNKNTCIKTSEEVCAEVKHATRNDIVCYDYSNTTIEDRKRTLNSVTGKVIREMSDIFNHLKEQMGFVFTGDDYMKTIGHYSPTEDGYSNFPYFQSTIFDGNKDYILTYCYNLFVHAQYCFIRLIGQWFINRLKTNGNNHKRIVKYILENSDVFKYFLFDPKNVYLMEQIFGLKSSDKTITEHYTKTYTGHFKKSNNFKPSENPQTSSQNMTAVNTAVNTAINTAVNTAVNTTQVLAQKETFDKIFDKIFDKDKNYTGMEILEICVKAEIRDQLNMQMVRTAFLNSIQTQHEKMMKIEKCDFGKNYKRILSIFETEDDNLENLLKNNSSSAYIFLFFLKMASKFDKSFDTKDEFNFFDSALDEEDPRVLWINTRSAVLKTLSIFKFTGYSPEQFENIVQQIVLLDETFVKEFWDIFSDVPRAVISNVKSWSTFITDYFGPNGVGEDKGELQKYLICALILRTVENLQKDDNKQKIKVNWDPKYLWLSSSSAVKAFEIIEDIQKNSLPLPNVKNAKNVVVDTEKDGENNNSIEYFLNNTEVCDLAKSLKKQNVDIKNYAKIISDIGGADVEDFVHLLDDEEAQKSLKDEFKDAGIKAVHALLIVKALKQETNNLKFREDK